MSEARGDAQFHRVHICPQCGSTWTRNRGDGDLTIVCCACGSEVYGDDLAGEVIPDNMKMPATTKRRRRANGAAKAEKKGAGLQGLLPFTA